VDGFSLKKGNKLEMTVTDRGYNPGRKNKITNIAKRRDTFPLRLQHRCNTLSI
jgi:hypothetical protein